MRPEGWSSGLETREQPQIVVVHQILSVVASEGLEKGSFTPPHGQVSDFLDRHQRVLL
jgi:hypothetical protein